MTRKYSKIFLRRLRNNLPIEMVIYKILNIPCKISEGYFRFLCPICGEFTTAIKKEDNLARCFRCEQNFNPIDLYMEVKGNAFIDTVETLKPFLAKYEKPNNLGK